LPSKFNGNWLKHLRVISVFLKCKEKEEENKKTKYKEHETNFEGTYDG